jgi:hypothetical protein
MGSHSSWKSYLTHNEVQFYNRLFNVAKKSQSDRITGQEAVQFFAKTGLPNHTLSQVKPRQLIMNQESHMNWP